jgi:hypothetical protein
VIEESEEDGKVNQIIVRLGIWKNDDEWEVVTVTWRK